MSRLRQLPARALGGAARLLALTLLVALGHLLLLWLWNPRVSVPAPRQAALTWEAELDRRPASEVTVLLGGDTAPTDAATPLLLQNGYEYPFARTLDLLRGAHLAVVNLEAPVTTSERAFALFKNYTYKINPRAVQALRWAGVDAVSLGNNHTLDFGLQGLTDTLKHLRRGGIVPFGAGHSASDARRGVVFNVKGTRVGLLSYLEDSLMHSVYVRSFAWGGNPGVARMEAPNLRQDLARLRREADVVIVMVHWGRSYTGVTAIQRLYGRLMVDWGADVVVGHHPHIHHPVGLHRGRPILYSLGNYAFGTPGQDWFRHGMLARLVLRQRRVRRVELIPLLVQNREVLFQPDRATGPDAQQMLARLARDSAALGASLSIKSDMAVMELP